MIPRPNTISSRFEATIDTKKFFQISQNLIKSEDIGIRQYIIIKLGIEIGLTIIKTLIDIIDTS